MENSEENIELEWEEPKTSIEKAKFIVCHTYYFLRKFYEFKEIDEFAYSDIFAEYITKFKQIFTRCKIKDKLSFDLLNRSYEDNSSIKNESSINNDEEKTKEDMFYQLKYKQFINVMNNQSTKINDRNIIESLISLRNCFIYLEYLYSFLQKYPEKISHYIIKIHISFLLFIPEESAKRMINSDEYFYLNLIELKEIYDQINFIPSQFIKKLDAIWKAKFLYSINKLKNKKLLTLKGELNLLTNSLSKIKNDKIPFLIDYILNIFKSLSQDLDNNLNVDDLIVKYISSIKDKDKKYLCEILSNVDESNDIPAINYLYLISLNHFNQLDKKYDEKNSNQINKSESNIIIKKEEIIDDISNKLNKKENYNSKNNIKNVDVILYENFKKNFERIMKIEDLKINIKKIEEKESPLLSLEDIEQEENDIFQNYMNKA